MELQKNIRIAILAVAVAIPFTSCGCSGSKEAVAPKVDTPMPQIESAKVGAGGASKTKSAKATVPAS